MAGIDINRTTSGVELPPEVSSEIWASAAETSAVMQLARQINLPGGGVSVPIITGDAEADWVDETDEKPVSRATLDNKTITPYKLAVIEPFSNEFRRDLPALYGALQTRLPASLARKFDATVFGGGAPGSNFDTLEAVDAVDFTTDVWAGAIAAASSVAEGGGVLSGWALSPQGEALALGAVDDSGRPMFVSDLQREGSIGALLGRPVFLTSAVHATGNPDVIGFAGDWSSAVYGTVEGVQISVSDQATLTDGASTINLWQRNMFAVRAEVEIGFRVRSDDHFVRLTDGVASGG
jgi:HK97 family phage major capsid protein